MTHASLFSGIGGFDLAAEWAGWTNAFNCEIDLFCRTVLKYHFPNAVQYADIRTTDFTLWRGRIDVLTGGFPCQPFSLAGKRKGTEDDRYLWPAMLGVIRTIRPRWVVGENVLGIVNWSDGMVFEQVCADLEAEGYEVQPFVIPACGVGAPHRRDRVWFVAKNPECVRRDGDKSEEKPRAGGFGKSRTRDHVRIRREKGAAPDGSDAGSETMREGENGVHAVGYAADAACVGRVQGRSTGDRAIQNTQIGPNLYVSAERSGRKRSAADTDSPRFSAISVSRSADPQERSDESRRIVQHPGNDWRTLHTAPWENFPTQSPVCGRNDGISAGLDGITVPRWRKESIKAYGNAIVPQVALQIFETINEYERITASI